jgi:outer membrane lipoprotein-sorting protein
MRTILITAILAVFTTPLYSQSATEIIQKANDLLYGKKTFSEITMTITKPAWSRTVSMKSWSIEPDYSIVYITGPARDKGSVTLKRKNEVWNYIPSVQKTIKIPPSMMLTSWMGSDFTNDDLVRQSSIVNDYDHTLIREEKYDGNDCYKIQMIPKPDAGVVWGKLLVWVTTKGFMITKEEYYDEDGTLVRTMTATNPKNFDGHMMPSYWKMMPANKPGNSTAFEYETLKFNVQLEPGFFSLQNMNRIR